MSKNYGKSMVIFAFVQRMFTGKIQSFQKESKCSGILHEGKRFPHTDFTKVLSWSHKLAVIIKRNLLGLKITSLWALLPTSTKDNGNEAAPNTIIVFCMSIRLTVLIYVLLIWPVCMDMITVQYACAEIMLYMIGAMKSCYSSSVLCSIDCKKPQIRSLR